MIHPAFILVVVILITFGIGYLAGYKEGKHREKTKNFNKIKKGY